MRNSIQDFSLANRIYSGATVTFWTVSAGVKTSTKATLYSGLTGTTTLTNPQSLDSDGKFQQPVYIDAPVIATVSGLTIADHDTGIIQSVLSAASVNDVYDDFASTDVGEGSALIGFLQTGTGAAATTAQAKLREVVSVLDFGAVGNDATDNTSAFQAAITYLLSVGGGELFIPRGTYFFTGASSSLDPGAGGIVFRGEGMDASILHWAGSTTGAYTDDVNHVTSKALFRNYANTSKEGLRFDGLQFKGNWASGTIGGGSAMWLDYYDDILIRDCMFTLCTNTCMDFHFCRSFNCSDSVFIDNAKDCVRARDTSNCVVTGNYILRNGDDAIALHTSDSSIATRKIRRQIVIANNHIVNGGSIKAAGGREVIIQGNTMRFPNIVGIQVSVLETEAEGNVPIFGINISDNIISDLLTITSATPASTGIGIYIDGVAPRGSAGTHSTIPGRWDSTAGAFVYPWNYTEVDADDAANPVFPMTNVIVKGNILSRTSPVATNFSDYGFGSRISQGTAYDPAVDDTDLRQYFGVKVDGGGLRNSIVAHNSISHFLDGINLAAPTTHYDYTNVIIESNVISDCINRGILLNTAAFAADIMISRNVIDADPYRQNANSNTDGTYDANTIPYGIDIGSVEGVTVSYNRLKNCCVPILYNEATLNVVEGNIQYVGGTVTEGFNAANKGTGTVFNSASGFRSIVVDADPTSATYGNVVNVAYEGASAQPASGTWVRGTFVRNTAPAKDASNMSILGWNRVTTGTGNVAGTDWVIANVSHVSPAT